MDEDRLCCPECNHCMEDSEWKGLQDEDGDIECPECEEPINYDDLLSENLEDDDETDPEPDDDDK